MKTINTLKATDHPIIDKLININNGDTSNLEYSTTVFKTQEEYVRTMNFIGNNIIGSQIKNFVNTPLVAERGNDNKTYFSAANKGVGFGYIFIDYIKKNPLLVVVVDKTENDYTYTSCAFDKKTAAWKNGSSTTTQTNDVIGLQNFIITSLTADVLSFNNI